MFTVMVEIFSDEQSRGLRYIEAANSGGYQPTAAQVTEWVFRPGRRPAQRGPLIEPAKPPTFPAAVGSQLVDMGRAVGLQNDHRRRVLGLPAERLVTHECSTSGVVGVDPRRARHLWRLIQDTTTVRVLIGPLHSTNDQDLIELRQTLALADRPIEVRRAADGVLHDRFIIGDSGVMYSVGASWNSVGKHVTTIFQHPPVTADRLGEIAEQWWEGAAPVEPAAPFPIQPPAGVAAESPSTAPKAPPKPRRRGTTDAPPHRAPDTEPPATDDGE